MSDPAEASESAVSDERAVAMESAESAERAVATESAATKERAGPLECVETGERANQREGAEKEERAEAIESAASDERAARIESAEKAERPLHRQGYPQIWDSSHHLWEAQQKGWPAHLPHEAWTNLVRVLNQEKPVRGNSDDHPAFREDYAPNYMATPTAPEPEPDTVPGAKARR